MSHQGRYPVIYLTFKDHKALTWDEAFERLAIDIGNEFKRHAECVESLSPGNEREEPIIRGMGEKRGTKSMCFA